MRLTILCICLILVTLGTKAQDAKLLVGKKVQVVQESKLTNSVNMMGTDMTTDINSTTYSTAEIKKVTDSSIVLTYTTTRIKGHFSMMGQDNSYDSNDSSSVSNPMVASQLKNINQPVTYTIINGKAQSEGKKEAEEEQSLAKMLDAGRESIVEGFFVPSNVKAKTEGFKWRSDEKSDDDATKQSSINTLSKTNATEIEVTANTTMTVKGKVKMMGMDVNQNLSGSRTTLSSYTNKTGLLSVSTQKIAMSGTVEVMGNNIPITLKGVITTTVQ